MSSIRPTQRIYDVVKDIEDSYRLPSILRSFVWEEERICKLMDSLMNDYPIYGSDDPTLKDLFIKARDNLTEEIFRNFIPKRRKLIMSRVNEFLGFSK